MSTISRPKPLDVLSFKNYSLLDTFFVSKRTKRPAWVTVTVGPVTSLHSVSNAGYLNEQAQIHWPSEVNGKSKKTPVAIRIGDEILPEETFGQRKKGLFADTDNIPFTIEGLACKWTRETHSIVRDNAWVDDYMEWECVTEPAEPANVQSASSSKFMSLFKTREKANKPLTLLAQCRAPNGLMKGDHRIDIFDAGEPYIFQLLISAILLISNRDEWKKVQTQKSLQELEAMIALDTYES